MEEVFDAPTVEISEPLEGAFGKYLREYRLLNSLLLSLFFVTFLFVCLWGIIIWEAPPGDQGSDFSDPGKQPTSTKKQEQKVRLMQRQKSAKPTQTFTFRAQAISDISVPFVDIETRDLDPGVALSPMGNVGDVSVNVDMSVLGKAFSSSFMGVKSKANKIMFIIDYSASMRGRDKVMRSELCKAIEKLPAVGSVAVIFFSGPTWVAGEDAKALHGKWKGDNSKNGWKPVGGYEPKRPKWLPVTPSNKKKLTQAVKSTPLTFGTVWDNSFEWAFYMNPKPDVVYFMTDGNANDKFKGMEIIKQKRGGTKIYTIGYGAPAGAKGPLEEIAAMSGGKSKFVDMDEIRAMEKEIDKNPPKKN
ncbi:MAG: VWA domain-containing protein [Opitutae bacterium]|nr:VWA domain-containing protein [Opitutae bacterium]